MNKKNIFPLILGFLLTVSSFAQKNRDKDKLSFRGNNSNGKFVTSKPINFSVEPKLLWKQSIGSGYSEIQVSGDVIYTMESELKDSVSGSEFVSAYDANTGKLKWKTTVDSIFIDKDNFGNGPRSTPAVDENSVFCLSSFGKFTAVSKSNGKVIWKIDFVKDLKSNVSQWGFASSPIIFGDAVVVETGGADNKTFTAFSRKDGKILWSKADGSPSYCSPTKAVINEKEQIIFANGTTLYSFNEKGDTLWTSKSKINSPTAMPLFIAPDKIFVSAVRPVGSVLYQISKDWKITEVFSSAKMKNDWSSSCYDDSNIYGFNVAALRCISMKDGNTLWTKRGFGKGSLIMVNDKLVILSDRGKIIFAEAKGDKYAELTSFQALEGKSWTAPTFAGDRIYVRNLTETACYQLKSK